MSGSQLVVGFDLDMTLIDTAPGFRDVLAALGAELGVDFPVEEMTAKLGPPLDLLLAPYLAADAIPAAGDRFRALYPDHAIAGTPGASTVRTTRSPPYAGTAVASSWSPASTPPTPELHLDHLGLRRRPPRGLGVGRRQGRRAAPRGRDRSTSATTSHDVEGALAAGAISVSVLTGGCTREELRRGRHPRRARRPRDFPAWLDEHLLDLRLAALEADLRERGSVLVAYSGGADSAFLLAAAVRALGAGPGRRRDRLLRLAARCRSATRPASSPRASASRCSPRRPTRWSARATAPTPATAATSARPSCSTCSPARRRARSRPRRHRHQRRRRRRRLPAGHPRGRRARRDHAAARRRVSPRSRSGPPRGAGACRPGTSRPPPACRRRIAYGVEVTPHRLARVERAEVAVAARAGRRAGLVATCGCATSASGPRSRSTRPCCRSTPRSRARCSTAVRAAGFAEAAVDPRGFRSGSMNEAL